MSFEFELPTSTQLIKLNHAHPFILSCRITCLLFQDQQNSMQKFHVMLQVFSTMLLKQVAQWLHFFTNKSRLLYDLAMDNQTTNLQDTKRLHLMRPDRVLEWLLPNYSQCRCWQESMGHNFKAINRYHNNYAIEYET